MSKKRYYNPISGKYFWLTQEQVEAHRELDRQLAETLNSKHALERAQKRIAERRRMRKLGIH